jgi:hypothetical protein
VITFNVLFMPGAVARLLPFTLSLLQAPQARIRVVANGCTPDEVDLLRAASRVDERISSYALPQPDPIEHGRALNHLFERFDEPYFAFADSDVIAGGNFMTGLLPIASGTSVFSAPPVWLAEEEAVLPTEARHMGGHRRFLSDGTVVGNTFLAIYERAALEPVWRRAPRGFAIHYRYLLPRPIRTAFSKRGWRFQVFDSCRVVNLMLLLDGHRLENRAIPELHHIGSFNVREYVGRTAAWRDLTRLLSSKPGRSFRATVGTAAYILQGRWWRRREADRVRIRTRRETVVTYIDRVLDAILADRPVPAAPRTDSAEVDRKVAALVSTLEAHYRPNLTALESAQQAQDEAPERVILR